MPAAQKLPAGISRRADGKLLAQVWCKRREKRLSKTFASRELATAKMWRRETMRALDRREIAIGRSPRLREAAQAFLAGAEDGTIRTRSRRRYKPGTITRYRRALDQYLLPALGSVQLDEITTGELARFVSRIQAEGLAANTVRNEFMPLQSIYRWAVRLEFARVNPTGGVELPLDPGGRDRFASREEIGERLEALPVEDRALWATAFYAGLRYGELMALRWSDVDLALGLIYVQRSYDPQAKVTGPPKSRAGMRKIPIPVPLHKQLVELSERRLPRQPLVFSRHSLGGRRRGADGEFGASGVYQRAKRYWEPKGIRAMTLHDCRHTYASLMIAAGENAKALQTYLGHSSITTTFDRYGHLMPGAEQDSASRLSAYLEVSKLPDLRAPGSRP